RVSLSRSPARRFSRRLVIAAMAEGEGWRSPLARYIAAAYGLYPLDRLAHREASLRRLASLARRGNAVLIFPQGTHARPADEGGDPPAVRFKTGVSHVAEALGAPVVPFGVAGTEAAMPPFVKDVTGLVIGGVPVSLKRTTLAIAFGPPQRAAALPRAESRAGLPPASPMGCAPATPVQTRRSRSPAVGRTAPGATAAPARGPAGTCARHPAGGTSRRCTTARDGAPRRMD